MFYTVKETKTHQWSIRISNPNKENEKAWYLPTARADILLRHGIYLQQEPRLDLAESVLSSSQQGISPFSSPYPVLI
jgi:hypothetical protein